MDTAFGILIGAYGWLNDKLSAYITEHPFWCLFFGILWVAYHLERALHRRFDAISAQLDRIEEKIHASY